MVAFLIGVLIGAVFSALILLTIIGAKSNQNPCDSCKFKKVGVDIITGELQYPCIRCCNQYPDLYLEVEQ